MLQKSLTTTLEGKFRTKPVANPEAKPQKPPQDTPVATPASESLTEPETKPEDKPDTQERPLAPAEEEQGANIADLMKRLSLLK